MVADREPGVRPRRQQFPAVARGGLDLNAVAAPGASWALDYEVRDVGPRHLDGPHEPVVRESVRIREEADTPAAVCVGDGDQRNDDTGGKAAGRMRAGGRLHDRYHRDDDREPPPVAALGRDEDGHKVAVEHATAREDGNSDTCFRVMIVARLPRGRRFAHNVA